MHKFRENVLESSRNVSETTPRTSKVRDWPYKCPNINPATMAVQLRVAVQQAWDVLRPVALRTLVQSRVKSLLSLCLLLHCGIEGDEIVDQLAKGTLDHDIDPLTTVRYADLKPMVNSYFQQEVQIKMYPYHGYAMRKFQWILPFCMKPISFQSKASKLFVQSPQLYLLNLPEETKCVFPTYW